MARAKELGIAGLVVGGIHDKDLRALLGYDLGVAITGTEQVGFTLILTEGFGTIPMASKTFRLLSMSCGSEGLDLRSHANPGGRDSPRNHYSPLVISWTGTV